MKREREARERNEACEIIAFFRAFRLVRMLRVLLRSQAGLRVPETLGASPLQRSPLAILLLKNMVASSAAAYPTVMPHIDHCHSLVGVEANGGQLNPSC